MGADYRRYARLWFWLGVPAFTSPSDGRLVTFVARDNARPNDVIVETPTSSSSDG